MRGLVLLAASALSLGVCATGSAPDERPAAPAPELAAAPPATIAEPPPPGPDGDRDGVPDDDDACPELAEDRDQFQDGDGCPDLDDDGDEIPDKDDACPADAEDHDGDADADGCPDLAASLGPCTVDAGAKIEFDIDDWTIRPSSYATLDELVHLLRIRPGVTLEIAGHLADDGRPAYGRKLSQRRAEAVREYLVDKGVDPERLRAVGYESDRPIVPNDTPEHRAQNRRIEFERSDNPECP